MITLIAVFAAIIVAGIITCWRIRHTGNTDQVIDMIRTVHRLRHNRP